MIYLIDPMKTKLELCPLKFIIVCPTKCTGVEHPLYGVPI